ncbi:MAG: ROK family transcriptional regulator [Spirochaetes bacterium]|nr:ROK family transcriptional regulator [Spirochaetota bacterium]MBN2772473.1 ROK family transcriptional regulator [Spirochaetota bacterium]
MIQIDGVYQKVVKQSNRRKIFNYIRKKRVVTKLDIARDLDLSITTVSSNVSWLTNKGFVTDNNHDSSTGGRKARLIEFNPSACFSIGVEFKETHARIVMIDLDYRIINESILESLNLSTIPDQTMQMIDRFISGNNSDKRIAGIGISVPGIVDKEHRMLLNAPNMEVQNIDFSSVVQKYSPLPVYIENEANCAAFAEFKDSDSKGTLCYVSITEGIGGALIINNRLITGTSNRAGEFGHTVIERGGRKCHCGNSGCWEQYASEQALRRMFAEKSIDLSIDMAFDKYGEDSKITEIIDNYAGQIAIGLYNLFMVFDPGVIIVGGSIARHESVLKPLVTDWISRHTRLLTDREVPVIYSSFGGDAGVIGAGVFPFTEIL